MRTTGLPAAARLEGLMPARARLFVAFGLGLVLTDAARAARDASPRDELTVFFTSEVRGNLKPCG